jgi:hypothetical protein
MTASALQRPLKVALIAAEALALRACVPSDPDFDERMAHVHLWLVAGPRVMARALLSPQDFRRFRRYGGNVIEARSLGGLDVTLGLSRANGECDVPKPSDAPQAVQVRQYADQFGRVHIELIDDEGDILGRATFEVGKYSEFIGDGCDIIEIVSRGGLVAQPCMGEA